MEQTISPAAAVPLESPAESGQEASDWPVRPDPSAERRESRALLAWVTDESAQLMLLEGQQNDQFTPAHQARLDRVRRGLAARAGNGVDQTEVVRPMPMSMASYVGRLERNPQAKAYFEEGWRPALVDLTRLCAFQPFVFSDHARERVDAARIDDVRSLAEVTLPLEPAVPVTFQYDRRRQLFITSLANQNLQIVGAFGGLAPGMPAGTVHMGFQVRMVTSFVQVGSMQGRYFLRDGYHRSIGLISRGARYVPAFVREDMTMADLIAPGALEFESILGPKPPVLTDYWDDDVSVTLRLPSPRRVISIQASELSVYG